MRTLDRVLLIESFGQSSISVQLLLLALVRLGRGWCAASTASAASLSACLLLIWALPPTAIRLPLCMVALRQMIDWPSSVMANDWLLHHQSLGAQFFFAGARLLAAQNSITASPLSNESTHLRPVRH